MTMFDVASRQCHGPHGGPGTRDVDGGDKNVFSCEIYSERKKGESLARKIGLQKLILSVIRAH